MQIRITRDMFLKGLSRVLGVVERKSTMPILSNTLIEANADNSVRLTGTNLDVGVLGSYEAVVKKAGRVALDAKRLHDIARAADADDIVLAQTEGAGGDTNYWVEVTAGKAKFKIAGLPPDEFPSPLKVDDAKTAAVPAATLRTMLDKTAFSISTDETRYNMSGVYLEVVKDSAKKPLLRMVSTDTHRLSLIDHEVSKAPKLEKKGDDNEGVILPRKGVGELRKLADDAGDEEIEIGFTKKAAVARFGTTELSMRLVDGTFPNYKQVIPSLDDQNKTLRIGRNTFASILKRVSILSSDRIKGVKFDLSSQRQILSASSPDLGEAREEFEASFTGEELVIGFNATYLLDALNVLDSDEVELLLNNDSSPGVLREPGNDAYTYVIMPMRI